MLIRQLGPFFAGVISLGILLILLGAGGVVDNPNGVAPDRYVYYPGTEILAEDEIRVIACGTGLPAARRSQAATCFLIEAGNGDKFLFDIGTGSAERISALQIPYNYLDKIFISHLHTGHFGDLDALFVGGALAGRQKPLRVWGPSGDQSAIPGGGVALHRGFGNVGRFLNWCFVAHLTSALSVKDFCALLQPEMSHAGRDGAPV